MLGLELNRIDTSTALSQALLSMRDVQGASKAADEAISIVNRLRVKSANPEWRARFLSARYAPYEARIAADLAAADAGAVWRAFRTAEEFAPDRLQMSLQSLRAVRPTLRPGRTALRASLTTQQQRLESRMQRQDADEAGTMAMRHSIEETRAQLDANRSRHGGVAATRASLPESLQEVQQNCLQIPWCWHISLGTTALMSGCSRAANCATLFSRQEFTAGCNRHDDRGVTRRCATCQR